MAGDIPSQKIYEDDLVFAFKDINPAAPTHLLIIPKKHISSLNELADGDKELAGHILVIARKIAQDQGFAKSGYRVVNNCGKNGGQTVDHLHFHLLAERELGWPPG